MLKCKTTSFGHSPLILYSSFPYSSHVFSLSFRVVTYNVLADLYADSDFSRTVLYPYCSPYALNMDYRKQLLVKEIRGMMSVLDLDQCFMPDFNTLQVHT